MTTKSSSNVDTLKVCVDGKQLFDELLSKDHFYFADGEVAVTGRIQKPNGEVQKINAEIMQNGLPYCFADLELTDGFSWVTVQNEAFYDVLTTVMYGHGEIEKVSIASTLEDTLSSIGLPFLHITSVDVCLDVNINAVKRLRKAIKDVEGLVMIVNGKRVNDNEHCVDYYFQANRNRLIGQPSIYRKGSLDLKVYDKARELSEVSLQKEEYTRNWSGIKGKPLYRVELHIGRGHIEKYCAANNITQLDCLDNLLSSEVFRLNLLGLCDNVLRFNTVEAANRKKSEKISVLDIVNCRYHH